MILENAVYLIFGLAFMAFGAIPLIEHYFNISNLKLAKGRILKADVMKEKYLWPVTLKPDVEYEFSIDGKTYHGNKIYSLTNSSISLFPFGSVDTRIYSIRKLGPQRETNIYYNPKNPEESYLQLDGLHLSILLKSIFFILGLIIFSSVSISLVMSLIKGG